MYRVRIPIRTWRTLTSVAAATCAALAGSAGCTRIDAPSGYVVVRDPYGYDFKAVSASGSVFAMTARENPNRDAGLDFWTRAVEHQKVTLEGYRLSGRSEIKTRAGQPGALFDLRVGSGNNEYTYLIGLFVTPRTIYTVEAGGLSKQIENDRVAIGEAMASLRP